MTSPAKDASGGGTSLALRLALAFLAVALAAVALLAILTAVLAASDVSALVNRQRTDLTAAVAVSASAAWERNNSWTDADLGPVLDLVQRFGSPGAEVQVRDTAGAMVETSPGFAGLRCSPTAPRWAPCSPGSAAPGLRGLTAPCWPRCSGPSLAPPDWQRCSL